MYDNLNFPFLVCKNLHLHFVTFLLLVSILITSVCSNTAKSGSVNAVRPSVHDHALTL